jgi:hypothetical protein
MARKPGTQAVPVTHHRPRAAVSRGLLMHMACKTPRADWTLLGRTWLFRLMTTSDRGARPWQFVTLWRLPDGSIAQW